MTCKRYTPTTLLVAFRGGIRRAQRIPGVTRQPPAGVDRLVVRQRLEEEPLLRGERPTT